MIVTNPRVIKLKKKYQPSRIYSVLYNNQYATKLTDTMINGIGKEEHFNFKFVFKNLKHFKFVFKSQL